MSVASAAAQDGVRAQEASMSAPPISDDDSSASELSDESDLDADELMALGTVDDADWELSRGDFTKQYNRARQIASALRHEPEAKRDDSVALPAMNRARPRARPAAKAQDAAVVDDAPPGEDHAAHASKTAAQISALGQFASRVHIEEQYDPSLVAGGSVDSRVPRKTNRTEVNRRKDKADRATLQQVLDPRTLLILYKMIKRELLVMVNGCVSTGKEANVYHATTPPSEPGASQGSAAIKIYKTSILVFKDRDKYVSGEFRFRHGYSRHNPRKMVRLWAEKEMRNLKRLVNAELRAPAPIELRDHVLVMEFLGDADGWPSPRLKDAESAIDQADWPRLYRELLAAVRLMFHRCRLVHADLSEYNILFHDGHLWIIDVSQSVEHDHPHAFDFLREDISHVDDYFARHGVATLGLRQTFHFVVREGARGRKGGVAGLEKLAEADEQGDAAVLDLTTEAGDQVETLASLEAELAMLMDAAAQDDATEQHEHEDAVFRQSYIPRNLDELYDPERDAAMAQAGDAQELIYAKTSGLDQVYAKEGPAGETEEQGEEEEGQAGEDDEDEDEDEDEEEDDSDADSDSLDPDARRQRERESRKEHKKEVKVANRERRKTKMPKAEKKKKMKKTGRKK